MSSGPGDGAEARAHLITIGTTSSRYCGRDATAYNNLDATADKGLAVTKMNPEQRMLSGFLQATSGDRLEIRRSTGWSRHHVPVRQTAQG
jgi:hypothetical protein